MPTAEDERDLLEGRQEWRRGPKAEDDDDSWRSNAGARRSRRRTSGSDRSDRHPLDVEEQSGDGEREEEGGGGGRKSPADLHAAEEDRDLGHEDAGRWQPGQGQAGDDERPTVGG
jgi:hypothetical protein